MKFLGVAALAAAALIPSAAAGGGPAAALGVSPLRLELKGTTPSAITVRNPTARPLVVTVSRAGFARTLRGKPRIKAARGAAGWLLVRPHRRLLAPHSTASFRVTAAPPTRARPGDHPALVLLATRPPADEQVHVLLRVGVVVLVRVPGTIVHQLVPQALSVHRKGAARMFSLRLANRGNVAERLGASRLHLVLMRRGARTQTLRAHRLEILPHSAGIAQFVYRGRLRGPVFARVVLQKGPVRTFHVTIP
ncbi:MAG: hypothetical protein QOG85_2004 [Gaiellaceae bacterium]|jgi:hypothetical protein|nr:hypothetical protein [Gaiellaceae bacterium]